MRTSSNACSEGAATRQTLPRRGFPQFHSPAYPQLSTGLTSIFTQILHKFMHRLLSWQAKRLQVTMSQRRTTVMSRYALVPGRQEVAFVRFAC